MCMFEMISTSPMYRLCICRKIGVAGEKIGLAPPGTIDQDRLWPNKGMNIDDLKDKRIKKDDLQDCQSISHGGRGS